MSEPQELRPDEDREKIDKREEQKALDSRSIYVGNIDFQATPTDLQEFFSTSGLINRITILNDRYTGRPKGFAYIEFDSAEAIANAIKLDGVEFMGRPLKVAAKRTNLPGRGFRGRGRGAFRGRDRGRGRGRGGFDNSRSDAISSSADAEVGETTAPASVEE